MRRGDCKPADNEERDISSAASPLCICRWMEETTSAGREENPAPNSVKNSNGTQNFLQPGIVAHLSRRALRVFGLVLRVDNGLFHIDRDVWVFKEIIDFQGQ